METIIKPKFKNPAIIINFKAGDFEIDIKWGLN